VNKETGEQKEVIMSVDEWDQWKKIIPNGYEIGLTPQLAQHLENWERFMINLKNLTLDGTTFFYKHQRFLDQK
jgi:hypothetical protein